MRALALFLLFAAPAAAQMTSGDLQRFTPSGTPYTGFAASAGELLLPGEYVLGAHFNYARNPLVFIVDGHRTASSIRVNSTLQLHAVLGILERFELSMGLPIVLHQGGGDPLFDGGPGSAVGDLRVRPRIQLLQQARNGIALTLSPTVTIPVTRSNSPYSEGSVRLLPEAGVSWRGPRWFFSADLLFRWRASQEPVERALIGRELDVVASVGRVVTREIEAMVELNGGLALKTASQGSTGNPLEAMLGLRFRLAESWTLDVAAGAGILSAPGVPDFRGVVGLQWGAGRPRAPETCVLHDPAGDRLVNKLGRDTDGDGLDDACDLCPNQASSAPGGCAPPVVAPAPPPPAPPKPAPAPPPPPPPKAKRAPPKTTIKVPPVRLKTPPPAPTTARRVLFLPIQFDFDKDTIRPKSMKLVQQVVDELHRLPPMMVCRVLGHTDDRGTAEYNLDLSRRRSESVVREMIKLGADPARLTVRGLGVVQPTAHDETQPAAPDRSAKGRQKNRRVEFVFAMPADLDQDTSATALKAEVPAAPEGAPKGTAKGAESLPPIPAPASPAKPSAAPPPGGPK